MDPSLVFQPNLWPHRATTHLTGRTEAVAGWEDGDGITTVGPLTGAAHAPRIRPASQYASLLAARDAVPHPGGRDPAAVLTLV
jgi:hypothetical protein